MKISAYPNASLPLSGSELVPIVQSGATVKVPASTLSAYAVSPYIAAISQTQNLSLESGYLDMVRDSSGKVIRWTSPDGTSWFTKLGIAPNYITYAMLAATVQGQLPPVGTAFTPAGTLTYAALPLESGYLRLTRDAAGNALEWITQDGTVGWTKVALPPASVGYSALATAVQGLLPPPGQSAAGVLPLESGYLRLTRDSSGKALEWITNDGTVGWTKVALPLNSVGYAQLSAALQQSVPTIPAAYTPLSAASIGALAIESGYLYLVRDSSGKAIEWITADGTAGWAKVALPAKCVGASQLGADALALIATPQYRITGYKSGGYRQLQARSLATTALTQLTLGGPYAGGDCTEPQLSGADNYVLFWSAAAGRTIAVPAIGPATAAIYADPDVDIVAFGDSLTQGAGAGTSGAPNPAGNPYPPGGYTAILAQMLNGRNVDNEGLGGQTSRQINTRFIGFVGTFSSPSGLSASAANPIATCQGIAIGGMVDSSGNGIVNDQPLSTPAQTSLGSNYANGQTGTCYITGTSSSFHGTLQQTATALYQGNGSTTAETYTITADSGATVPAAAPNGFTWVPDQIAASPATGFKYNKTLVFAYGRNNQQEPAQIQADAIASIGFLKPYLKRFIVTSILGWPGEIIGSGSYNNRAQYSAAMLQLYPNNFCPAFDAPTQAECTAVGYTCTSQDLIDIANGLFPTGMRAAYSGTTVTNGHLNDYGYAVVAMRLKNFIIAKGW